jgi:hypothetical protein
MANIVPYAFPVELLSGTHQFQTGGNSFKLALYTANPYTTASTVYSATSEVSSGGGSQYTATGNVLTSQAVSNVANVATVDFADSVWGTPSRIFYSGLWSNI